MRKLTPVPMDATAHAVYLTGAAINSLIQALPSGTAYGIGIVRIVMMTGRLMQHKGSLARAVLPLVIHLKWGWHRAYLLVGGGHYSGSHTDHIQNPTCLKKPLASLGERVCKA